MSEKTLREACEAVLNSPTMCDDAWDETQEALMAIIGGRGIKHLSATILAALDAEREAGRREVLEEVRAWLEHTEPSAHSCACFWRTPTMTDLDEFERLARESGLTWSRLSIEWSKVVSASTTGLDPEDNAYIAAASPDVILDLIARVRAAEGTVALLSDEMRRKGLTSGSAMAAHLDVELERMKPKP